MAEPLVTSCGRTLDVSRIDGVQVKRSKQVPLGQLAIRSTIPLVITTEIDITTILEREDGPVQTTEPGSITSGRLAQGRMSSNTTESESVVSMGGTEKPSRWPWGNKRVLIITVNPGTTVRSR